MAGIFGGKMEGVTVEVGEEEEGRQSQSGGAEGGQEPAMVHPCAKLWRGFRGSNGRGQEKD